MAANIYIYTPTMFAFGLILFSILTLISIFRNYIRRWFLSFQFEGPPAIFILGNVQVAKRWQPEDLVQLLYDISGKYGATFRIWIGTELNIFTSDCKFIESVLNSNGLITKAHEYDYLRPWIRDGLLLSSGKDG